MIWLWADSRQISLPHYTHQHIPAEHSASLVHVELTETISPTKHPAKVIKYYIIFTFLSEQQPKTSSRAVCENNFCIALQKNPYLPSAKTKCGAPGGWCSRPQIYTQSYFHLARPGSLECQLGTHLHLISARRRKLDMKIGRKFNVDHPAAPADAMPQASHFGVKIGFHSKREVYH